MKKIFYNTLKVIILLIAVFMNSCAEDPTASLQGYPSQNLPAPILSTVDPSDQALAGVTIITITGSNFSADARNNLVYFNGIPGTILNATTTQLTVRVPNVVSDTTMVTIAVVGAKDFSNAYQYKTLAAWEEIYPFDKVSEKNYGIIIDNGNNLLVSIKGKGIWKITPPPDTSKSIYVPIGTYTGKWDNFRYGPGGELYAAKAARGVWKIVEGVAPPSSPWASPTAGSISAIEFDVNQNLWALNSTNTIFRFKQDGTVTSFPFPGELKAIRIFGTDLFVAATKDNITTGVWKIPITANGDLGVEELYFETSSIRLGAKIIAMTFAADGDLILGLDKGPNPLLVVKPDKSYEELYPGVIGANSVVSMYWPPTGTSLYFVRGEELNTDDPPKIIVSQTTIRVEMEKNGAPYYGQ